MRRIAPDVERLMWLVAEERDPKAIADFEARFPELKYELSKHISMVNGLKSAGRKVPTPSIPRFVPPVSAAQPQRRGLYLSLAMVAAAVAFGSYAGLSAFGHSPAKVAPKVDTPVVTDTNEHSENPFAIKPPQSTPKESSPARPGDVSPNEVIDSDPLRKPVTLDLERAPLSQAIALVCEQAGLHCEVAPGMPEVDVELRYPGVPAGAILNDLGQKYGFSAFPQEKGKVLIIPARPNTEGGEDGTTTSSTAEPSKIAPDRADPDRQ